MRLTPPPNFEKRLRETIGEKTLTVLFDPEASDRLGQQCWSVYYEERGVPTWVCDWQGSLDGALDGLCQRIAKYDYARNKGMKYYAQKLDQKMQRMREAKLKRRMDIWNDYADYARKAFQAYMDGAPTVGAKRPSSWR